MNDFDVKKRIQNTIIVANVNEDYSMTTAKNVVVDVLRATDSLFCQEEVSLLSADFFKSMNHYQGPLSFEERNGQIFISSNRVPVLAVLKVPYDAFDNEAMVSHSVMNGTPRWCKRAISRGVIFGSHGVFFNHGGGTNFILSLPDYRNHGSVTRCLKYRYVPDGEYEKKIYIDRLRNVKTVVDGDNITMTSYNPFSVLENGQIEEKVKKRIG